MTASAMLRTDRKRASRFAAPVVLPVLVSLAYYAGAEAAFAIGTLNQLFAPFWPPNVVLLCALLSVPERRWWMYVLAVFPAHVAAELGVGMPVLQLLTAFVCNVAVALLNAIALRRLVGGPPWFGDLRRAVLYLLFTVVLSPGLVAFAGGAEPILGDGEASRYWDYWWRWYLSNALGSLTLTPVFLTWFAKDRLEWLNLAPGRRSVEAVALTAGMTVVCAIALREPAEWAPDWFLPALLYAPVPLLLWAAVRFGARGASGAVLVVTVIALWHAMQGQGLFTATDPNESALALQVFLAVISVPVLLLAALIEELHRTNNRFAAVLEGISDCYFTLDRNWRFTAANPKAAAWLGDGSPEAMVNASYRNALGGAPPEAAISRTMQYGVPVHAETELATTPNTWIELHTYPSADGVRVFFRDITKRKLGEMELRATHELLQSTMDALSAQIAILDAEGRIVAVNAPWRRFAEAHGCAAAVGIGANHLQVNDAARLGHHAPGEAGDGLRAVMRGECDEFRFEYPCECAQDHRWFQLRATRFGSGKNLRLVVANEDITELKRSEESLRQLTGEMQRLRDEERRRIARELHDSTAQNLLGASLAVDRALRVMPETAVHAATFLKESRGLIEQSQREIRTVSYLLHPPFLEECGLPSALGWYVEGFSKRSGIAVTVDVSPELAERRLPPEVETALFRVVQEGLTNIHRHSGSQVAHIRLAHQRPSSDRTTVALEITDEGRGVRRRIGTHPPLPRNPAGRASFGLGVGLAGMRERVRQLGGRFDIRSSAQGTILRVTVPVGGADARASA